MFYRIGAVKTLFVSAVKKNFKSYKSEKRKFCSSSCAAIVNNKNFIKREKRRKSYHEKKEKKCLNCEKIITNKFCDSICQNNFRKKETYKKIESGDITLNYRHYKKYLIEKFGEKCMKCDWCEIHQITGKVPIELEHCDGDSENNSLSNLKLLCPNCHSLTPTYKALNVGNGRHKRMERYKNGKSF